MVREMAKNTGYRPPPRTSIRSYSPDSAKEVVAYCLRSKRITPPGQANWCCAAIVGPWTPRRFVMTSHSL
jgi:hypothetical protein